MYRWDIWLWDRYGKTSVIAGAVFADNAKEAVKTFLEQFGDYLPKNLNYTAELIDLL
jgi:hypothetical protein